MLNLIKTRKKQDRDKDRDAGSVFGGIAGRRLFGGGGKSHSVDTSGETQQDHFTHPTDAEHQQQQQVLAADPEEYLPYSAPGAKARQHPTEHSDRRSPELQTDHHSSTSSSDTMIGNGRVMLSGSISSSRENSADREGGIGGGHELLLLQSGQPPPDLINVRPSSRTQYNLGEVSQGALLITEQSSSSSRRPSSRQGSSERPSSRMSNSSRSRAAGPKLGVGSYLFEDDPGIMSEVETSSTRFRRSSATSASRAPPERPSSRSGRPRTSPTSQPSRGYSVTSGSGHHVRIRTPSFDDDPGIMSEAETSSTTRSSKRRGRNALAMGMHHHNAHTSLHSGHHRSGRGSRPSSRQALYGTDDDPGIMSEAETSSTSSHNRRIQHTTRTARDEPKALLPVVRTPSKTLERPLGIVFLIYRGETKRALLPNEITSLITVKALFVRSFSHVLTLDYMDTPRVNIYILDSAKDQFHELLDLNDIRDRTILKVYEHDSSGRGPGGLGPQGLPPITNLDELAGAMVPGEPEYGYLVPNSTKLSTRSGVIREGAVVPPSSRTLPRNTFSTLSEQQQQESSTKGRGGAYSSAGNQAASLGERSKTLGPGFMRGHRLIPGTRVESGYISSPDGNYEFDQQQKVVVIPNSRIPQSSRFSSHNVPYEGHFYPRPASTEEAKARMMHMEAQLSQLTGMVEKALKNKRFGGKKQVSFDKSVTFNDEPQTAPSSNNGAGSSHREQPQGILSTSKRSRSSSASRALQHHSHGHSHNHGHSHQSPTELQSHLKRLHRSTRELKQEVRVLRRLTQLQSMAMKDLVQDTYLKLREACISFSSQNGLLSSAENLEHLRIAQDEEVFSRELNTLLTNLSDLEKRVEVIRSGVINKKNKISLQDVEALALSLSHCSKTVTGLRQVFPALEANLRESRDKTPSLMVEFLKRSSERLDSAWKRCKKLTGTLVTLKRLASVQEQRFHPGGGSGSSDHSLSLSPTPADKHQQKENSLDDLLDALQSYTVPPASGSTGPAVNGKKEQPTAKVKPLQDTASTSATVTPSPQKQVSIQPALSAPALAARGGKGPPPNPPPRPVVSASGKGAPPPPPPRTSSASTNGHRSSDSSSSSLSSLEVGDKNGLHESPSTSSSPITVVAVVGGIARAPTAEQSVSESKKANNSTSSSTDEEVLELRHKELLSRQKQLQEQYQRLQEMQKKSNSLPGQPASEEEAAAAAAAASAAVLAAGLQQAEGQEDQVEKPIESA